MSSAKAVQDRQQPQTILIGSGLKKMTEPVVQARLEHLTGFFADCEIYALSGKLGSGKNFIAENVLSPMLPPRNSVFLSFADHFKVDAITKDGLSYDRVFHDKDEATRRALQIRGTEQGRNIYGEGIWIDTLITWMRIHHERGVRRFFICDTRFRNECAELKRLGAVTVRVVAPGRNDQRLNIEAGGDQDRKDAIASHPSETDLDLTIFDHVVYNDFGQDVFGQVRDLVFELRERRKSARVVFLDLDDTVCLTHPVYQEVIDMAMQRTSEAIQASKGVLEFDTFTGRKSFSEIFTSHFNDTGGRFEHVAFRRHGFADDLLATCTYFKESITPELWEELRKTVETLAGRVYSHVYSPLPGAVEAVTELRKESRVVVVTVGERADQVRKLAMMGLHGLEVETSDVKNATVFRNLMRKYPAMEYVVIGDSLVRDIKPAVEAGIDHVCHITVNRKDYSKTVDAYAAVRSFTTLADAVAGLPPVPALDFD